MELERKAKKILKDMKKVRTAEELQRIAEGGDNRMLFIDFEAWAQADPKSPLLKEFIKEVNRIIGTEWTNLLGDLEKVNTVEELWQVVNQYKGFILSGALLLWELVNPKSPLITAFDEQRRRLFKLLKGEDAPTKETRISRRRLVEQLVKLHGAHQTLQQQ